MTIVTTHYRYKRPPISADLRERGVQMSHMTVQKIIVDRGTAV